MKVFFSLQITSSWLSSLPLNLFSCSKWRLTAFRTIGRKPGWFNQYQWVVEEVGHFQSKSLCVYLSVKSPREWRWWGKDSWNMMARVFLACLFLWWRKDSDDVGVNDTLNHNTWSWHRLFLSHTFFPLFPASGASSSFLCPLFSNTSDVTTDEDNFSFITLPLPVIGRLRAWETCIYSVIDFVMQTDIPVLLLTSSLPVSFSITSSLTSWMNTDIKHGVHDHRSLGTWGQKPRWFPGLFRVSGCLCQPLQWVSLSFYLFLFVPHTCCTKKPLISGKTWCKQNKKEGKHTSHGSNNAYLRRGLKSAWNAHTIFSSDIISLLITSASTLSSFFWSLTKTHKTTNIHTQPLQW